MRTICGVVTMMYNEKGMSAYLPVCPAATVYIFIVLVLQSVWVYLSVFMSAYHYSLLFHLASCPHCTACLS